MTFLLTTHNFSSNSVHLFSTPASLSFSILSNRYLPGWRLIFKLSTLLKLNFFLLASHNNLPKLILAHWLPLTLLTILIFTALHAMQTRSSDEISVCPSVRPSVRLSVCLSVRLSVKCVHCDKMEEKSVQIFIPCERSFCLLLWEEEWLVGGDPFYMKFWVNRPALERNRQFWTNNRS